MPLPKLAFGDGIGLAVPALQDVFRVGHAKPAGRQECGIAVFEADEEGLVYAAHLHGVGVDKHFLPLWSFPV